MISSKKNNLTGIIFTALLLAGSLIFFGVFYRYHIYFEEQLQTFLLTFDHFLSYLHKPAFLASYTGDFFTQFFYLRSGGAVVITSNLLVLWFSLRLLLRRSDDRGYQVMFPMIPVAFCWIALCNIEYPVSNVIALIISLLFILIYTSLRSFRARIVCGLIFIPVLYILAGSALFVFTISVILFEIFRSDSSASSPAKAFYSAALLVFALLTPLSLKGIYLLTGYQSLTYMSEMTKTPGLFHFFPMISVVLVLIFSWLQGTRQEETFTPVFYTTSHFVLLIGLLVMGIRFTADFTLEKVLRLDYEAYNNHWNKVYELTGKYRMRNRISSYYTNMALSKLGKMPDELMNYYQPAATGLFIPVDINENYMTIAMSNEIYWQLGDVNASQHSALLGTIFSPRAQNSRLMKRIAEINIINAQYAVAQKYLSILEKTLFHRKWAEERMKYLFNEEACSGAEWITVKRAVIPKNDILKERDEYIITLRMLADNNPENRMTVDYLLCFHLLSKDISAFATDFEHYYSPGLNPLLPKVYQEGLLIKIASGEKKPGDFSRYRFSPEIVKEMADYSKMYQANNGNGAALYEKYGTTYWFYYHFATMKTE